MSDKVQEYLEAGKRLEEAATPGPWEPGLGEVESKNGSIANVWSDNCDDVEFISDARERLPRYRRAIEAAIDEITKWSKRDGSKESQAVDYALAYVREAMQRALLGEEKANV